MTFESSSILKKSFFQLVNTYSKDVNKAKELWEEIHRYYTSVGRHYHTVSHLLHIYNELEQVRDQINCWDTVLFAVYYHDIIYNSIFGENEKKSAELAEKRLGEIQFPENKVKHCSQMILRTRNHKVSEDEDCNYFTDADLCILGQEWEIYEKYKENIRKEYASTRKITFDLGRKSILLHFLKMPRIFKTDYFYTKYEKRARSNLKRELKEL